MRKIDHHVGCVIIQSNSGEDFLFSMYDHTYPTICCRYKINFVGGNWEKGDYSPKEILLREIREEFLSCEEDVITIRDSIINNLIPYKDYFVEVPEIGQNLQHNALQSIFLSKIPQVVFENTRKNIKEGRNIINEGLMKICNIDELKSGEVQAAWATGGILGDYLGMTFPVMGGIRTTSLGTPRESMKDYNKDFEYSSL